jgi:hypothetical protein
LALSEKPKVPRLLTVLIRIVFTSLLTGGMVSYATSSFTFSSEIGDFQNCLSNLEKNVSDFQPTQSASNKNSICFLGEKCFTVSVIPAPREDHF